MTRTSRWPVVQALCLRAEHPDTDLAICGTCGARTATHDLRDNARRRPPARPHSLLALGP